MKYFIILFLIFPLVTLGSGTDIEQEVEVIGGTYSGGTTRAFSVGGGDMDINDCLATHSILFGLWQGTHINKLCEADRLNRDGLYRESAEMKCSIRSIRKIYGADCVADLELIYQPVEVIEEMVIVNDDDDEDWHEEQMQVQQAYDERINELERRLEQRSTRTVIKEEPWMTDEKRAKLEAVLAK